MKSCSSKDEVGESKAKLASEGTLVICSEQLMALAKLFDPALVTMSSTNLPDARVKLEAVLADTNTASLALLRLLGAQGELLQQGDEHLVALEKAASKGGCSAQEIRLFVQHYRELNERHRAVVSDIVVSQEYQDLCGQKVKKVSALLEVISSTLEQLLKAHKIECAPTEECPPLDQQDADKLLKDLGF